ncbi:BspA family leucine-rich repeat surface protein [Aquimarina sp. 2304DJ70-9]|uniref:BspA family leucine-rich repeat surface protein n=1 Tax=Aquimarina penaris TaxID=3231044 RepID=UPI00346330EF
MKHLYITLVFIISFFTAGFAQTEFITTWQTTSANESITIPTTGSGYNYSVDWGDGTIEAGFTGSATHEYVVANTYTVEISGDFPRFYNPGLGGYISNAAKIQSIEQWGTQQWTSMEGAFDSATSLVINATDTPDLSAVTSMQGMFFLSSSLVDNGGALGTWDVSNIQDMGFLFRNTPFNEDISSWNTQNVTNMRDMLANCPNFNQNLGDWDISNVTNMSDMFATSGLSLANYDATLIGWATDSSGNTTDGVDDVPSNITFHAGSSMYCLGVEAHNTLTSLPYDWSITDNGTTCTATDFFITTWQTTTSNESITIPTTGSGYNYSIDWGDGTIETGFTGNATHEYAVTGTYTAKITGDFPRIYFNNTGDKDKIRTIEQWGAISWSSMASAFYGCDSLVLNATDIPDLSSVTDLSQMFRRVGSFQDNQNRIGSWDVSTITNMSAMFREASDFNENIGLWNVGNVTNFSFMLSTTNFFNQNLNTWNIGENVTGTINMSGMFDSTSAFNQPLNDWDVSKVTNMSGMFGVTPQFNQPLNDWDTSAVSNMGGMFFGASRFDQNVGDWNLSSISNMSSMFQQSGLSQENYDAILIGWATQDIGETIPSNISISFEGSQYCFGADARNTLTNDAGLNWNIDDDGAACSTTDFFITTWQTAMDNESITIPTTGSGYNYAVDWGDDTIERGFTGDATHEYATAGTYTIKIIGDFPRIYFNNLGDKDKIISVNQWGVIEWASMESAFYGCTNLTVDASDTPDLTNSSTLRAMFKGTTNLIDVQGTLPFWNVSTIVDFGQMFMNTDKFNTSLISWNFSVAEDFSEMFRGAKVFNQLLGNPFKAKTFEGMFRDAVAFNQPLFWDTPDVISLKNMFNGATSFDQNLGFFTINSVTDMTGMFSNAGLSIQNYDQTLAGWFLERNVNDTRPNNITFDAGSSQYCLAGDIIEKLTNDHGWQITDSGPGCDESDVFVMTWDLTSENRFTMPTSGNGYEYTLSLSNGEIFYVTSDIVQVSYSENIGMLTVRIYGDFPRFDFDAPSVDKEKLATIEQWGSLQLLEANGAFEGCTNLVLNATDTPDLSQIQFMDRMFENTSSFVDNGGEMNNWDVSTVTSMTGLFEGSAFNENINDWDVSKVEDFSSMFKNNTSFNQPLNNWNTEKANDLTNMFDGATAFNQPIEMWNTALAQYFDFMFLNASTFDQNLGNWDISNTDRDSMDGMLTGSAMSQTNYDATLIGWATLETGETQIPTDVKLDADTFYCLSETARNTLTSAPYNWTINDAGIGCPEDFFITTWQTTTTNETITIPTTGSGYNYSVDWGDGTVEAGFTGNTTHSYTTAGVYTVKISGDFPRLWFTALTDDDKSKLLTVEQWGSQQWTTMRSAFQGCYNLKLNANDTPDLSQVTRTSSMFRDCTNLEDLKDTMNSWDMTNLESISFMFKGCTIFDENIGGWAFNNLTDAFNAFEAAAAFNQDISNWDVSKVDEFDAMFKDATSFNQPIGNWTLGTVDYIDRMFQGATAFNQDLSNWDFSNVYEAGNMFDGAASFNQDLSAWDISKVEALNNFFTGSGMSQENYDNTLIGWATLDVSETQIPADLTLNADATYCLAEAARNILTSTPYNWTINDGGQGCLTPVITLLGDNPQIIEQGGTYTELGATVTYGATLIIDASVVNINQLGMYTVTYNATSASGETATQVTRTVNVVEPCPILSVPANNFMVTTASETCVDKNNGMITISAVTALNYTTTINGADYNFTSSLEVADLPPGTYPVCIAVDGFANCEQCFEAVIDDAESLVGKTELITETGSAKINIEVTTGTAPYIARINDEVVGEYTTKTFTVDVQHGNELVISSSLECEGKLSTKVNLIDKLSIAPNPTQGDVTLFIPNDVITQIQVSMYNALGVQVSSGEYTITSGQLILPMQRLPHGVYFITVNKGKAFKVVKQ